MISREICKGLSYLPMKLITYPLYCVSKYIYIAFSRYFEKREKVLCSEQSERLVKYFEKRGNFASFLQKQSIDQEGNPVPWLTYPAIDFLNSLDISQCRVFEWGIGNSTIYWAKRAKSVIAVENNQEWYENIKNKLPDNAAPLFMDEPEKYANAITNYPETFDIIIIDGRYRKDCALVLAAKEKLSPGGIVILDNTGRNGEEREAINILQGMNLIRTDFTGVSPINNHETVTSVFFTRDFSIPLGYPPNCEDF